MKNNIHVFLINCCVNIFNVCCLFALSVFLFHYIVIFILRCFYNLFSSMKDKTKEDKRKKGSNKETKKVKS